MADMTPDQAIEKLKALPEDKQRAVLSALSPEQRKGILGKLKAKPAQSFPGDKESTGTKVARGAVVGAFEGLGVKPAASPGEVVTGTIKQFGQGISDLVGDTWNNNAAAGMTPFGPAGQAIATALDVVPNLIDRTATSLEQGGRRTIQDIKNKDYEAAAEHGASTLTQAALLKSPRAIAESEGLGIVGQLRQKAAKALAPHDVAIAGEKVPALVGEAEPSTISGRVQSSLKKSGVGAQRFKDFAVEQQNAVKQVIRKVAQQTSGAIGPMPEEASAAMSNAADATFEKARPMYQALDESMVDIPDGLSDVSKVTEAAIARAKKWGVELPDQEWNRTSPTTPIQTYMKVRSELLKMQRGATDAAQRYAIGNDLATMNANMDQAIGGTPLGDSWTEANRLWSKGYAIRDVADALRATTEGTPAAEQAAGVSKVPTQIKGAQLVSRLNDLKTDGILDRAFTPEEVRNLRQSADILDRASGGTGQEFGFGYSAHSSIWRNLIKQPAYPLVKAMTTPAGVQALKIGNMAEFLRLTGAAAAATSIPKTPGEARDRLRQFAPSPAQP